MVRNRVVSTLNIVSWLTGTARWELQTYDYRPGAVGGSAGGCGRAVLCARTGAGGGLSLTARHFSKAYNIFRTLIVWDTSERKSGSEIASQP